MNRRVKSFILASLFLLGSASAYAFGDQQAASCDVNCFCYISSYSGGECGTISSSGCITIHCI